MTTLTNVQCAKSLEDGIVYLCQILANLDREKRVLFGRIGREEVNQLPISLHAYVVPCPIPLFYPRIPVLPIVIDEAEFDRLYHRFRVFARENLVFADDAKILGKEIQIAFEKAHGRPVEKYKMFPKLMATFISDGLDGKRYRIEKKTTNRGPLYIGVSLRSQYVPTTSRETLTSHPSLPPKIPFPSPFPQAPSGSLPVSFPFPFSFPPATSLTTSGMIPSSSPSLIPPTTTPSLPSPFPPTISHPLPFPLPQTTPLTTPTIVPSSSLPSSLPLSVPLQKER